MNKEKIFQILLHILGIFICFIILLPLYLMVLCSLKPTNEIFNMQFLPNFNTLTLDNYKEVFLSQNFLAYIKNSAIVAVMTAAFSLFFHSMAGYTLARLNFPLKNTIFFWILSTMMVPFSVIMIPLFLITRSFGLANTYWGIIIPMIPNAYGIFLLRQFFLGIPKDLEESAWIDGSSLFRTYLEIVLPLAKPIIMTLGVFYFLGNWNSYLWPLIITTKKSLWLIQIGIANFRSEKTVLWNQILAASTVASLPTLLVFSYFQKYIVDGIKMTGLKG